MCVASLRSMTHAIKAQKALNEYNINSNIISLEPSMTKKGCAYGVEFNCINTNIVESIFKKKSVKYSQIITLN